MAFGLVKAAETISALPEDVRKQLLGALDEIDQSNVLERIGQDIGRGIVKGIMEGIAFWRKKS